MVAEENVEKKERPPHLGGGPLGLGDPEDLRLRKTERDLILPKMIREEAMKKCPETMKLFYECSKSAGLLVTFKCQEANKAYSDCIFSWVRNPEFEKEVTEKYLRARSHYRRTGEPLERYQRKKSPSSGMC